MRPLRVYAEAIKAMEGYEGEITPEWLAEQTTLSKRQVLDALKLARERGTLDWVSRGVYRRAQHPVGAA